jgi:D-3-phosphoglycerate dehydrogenase
MRILVVGDSFMPARIFEDAFTKIGRENEVRYLQVDGAGPEPRTPSERRIKETIGSPDDLLEHMAGVEVLVVHGAPVTDAVMDASGCLVAVGCARGGPVNVDVASAAERDVAVLTTPGKNADAVADQTLAFMIMLARGIPRALRFVGDGTSLDPSSNFQGSAFTGHDLSGHVLGLVGLGNVGKQVALRAAGFGMTIVGFDPYAGTESGTQVEAVQSLDELLARAGFVSLHARATPENENLFDEQRFEAMLPGSYFVNTARETLVDEDALDQALASGRLAGAALDVVRHRPSPGPHPLLRHDNVIITPHIGGATHETLANGATMLARQLSSFSRGEGRAADSDHLATTKPTQAS